MTSSSLPESESLTVEFKTSFNEDVVQSLSAFANTKGGSVYMRVNDSRKAKGVTLKDDLFSQVESILQFVRKHKAYLEAALSTGLIERTIPDKPNSRLQKYRRS